MDKLNKDPYLRLAAYLLNIHNYQYILVKEFLQNNFYFVFPKSFPRNSSRYNFPHLFAVVLFFFAIRLNLLIIYFFSSVVGKRTDMCVIYLVVFNKKDCNCNSKLFFLVALVILFILINACLNSFK